MDFNFYQEGETFLIEPEHFGSTNNRCCSETETGASDSKVHHDLATLDSLIDQ